MAYATVDEFGAYISPEQVEDTFEASRLLDRASEFLDECLIGSVYAVDDDGLPTEAAAVAALRDATCAQVAFWFETGDDQGVGGQYASVSIGDVSLTRSAGSVTRTRRLAPHAVTILRNASLLPLFPSVVG